MCRKIQHTVLNVARCVFLTVILKKKKKIVPDVVFAIKNVDNRLKLFLGNSKWITFKFSGKQDIF